MSEEEETPALHRWPMERREESRLRRGTDRRDSNVSQTSSLSRRSSFRHATNRTDSSAASVSPIQSLRLRQHRTPSIDDEDALQRLNHHPCLPDGADTTHSERVMPDAPLHVGPRHPQMDDSGDREKRMPVHTHRKSVERASTTGHPPAFPRLRRAHRDGAAILEEKSMQMAYSANEQRIEELERIVHDLSKELNRDDRNGTGSHSRSSRAQRQFKGRKFPGKMSNNFRSPNSQ